jgi:hypothetical protein
MPAYFGRAWYLARALFVIGAGVWTAAGQDTGFVGAEKCGACHREQFTAQSESGHARSLAPAGEHHLADRWLAQTRFSEGGFGYTLNRGDGGPVFQVRQSDAVREQVVDWAFGAGQQAVTFVSRLDEDFYVELRASYYPAASGLALTPGHQNHHPKDLDEALGVRHKTFSPRSEILSCFGCHSTGTLSLGERLDIKPNELGVRCEVCHGPGQKHVELLTKGAPAAAREAIGNPKRLKAPDLMRFCGECHRPPASEGIAIDWSDPWNVRHQPVYLTESACFKNSPGGLTCMQCHDPHSPLRRNDAAYYNARCSSCHTTESHPPAQVCRAEAGCASCHMPTVKPQPELAFHNHWIGIYQAGNPLKPQR